MSAPALIKHIPKSTISGSCAAFKILVSPFANTAVIIALSVAPTEIFGKLITPPLKPSDFNEA